MMKRFFRTNMGAALLNMLMAYVVFMVSRLAFFFENYATFAPDMSWGLAISMLKGSLVFDTSALLYINSLYLVLMLLPWGRKEVPGFHRFLKWLFVVINSIGVALNLGDAVYVAYTGRRSTITVFSEFVNENNIASIFLTEFVNHWYLVLLFVVIVSLMWLCYRTPDKCVWGKRWRYYVAQAVTLLVLAPHRRQKRAGNVLTHGASPWRRYGCVLRQFAREQPSAIGVQRLYLLHHRGGHRTYRRHLCGAALPVPARTRGNDCTPMPTHTAHPHRDRHRVDDHTASVLPHGHQHGRVPCVGPAIATDFERWYVNHNYKLRLCHSAEHQPHRGRLN